MNISISGTYMYVDSRVFKKKVDTIRFSIKLLVFICGIWIIEHGKKNNISSVFISVKCVQHDRRGHMFTQENVSAR